VSSAPTTPTDTLDFHTEFVRRALSDTGFFARRVLGFDYDKDPKDDEKRINIGTGGIRDNGPHQRMTRFFDEAGPGIHHLEAPRGSYKTTLCMAYMMRRAIRNPNIRILYVREVHKEAKNILRTMQQFFEENEKVLALFGHMRSSKWGKTGDEFTVAGRTLIAPEPTFKSGGVDVSMTGIHPDIIIADDLVTWDNVRTEDGREKTKACIKMLVPLLMGGGTLFIIGTRYAGGDAYDFVMNELKGVRVEIIEAGVEMVKDEEEGIVKLVGTPTFEHQPISYLQSKLNSMRAADFASQYLNRIISGDTQPFTKEQFRLCTLHQDTISTLSGYILTDTATKPEEDACHSVIAVVGMDATDTAYVLDVSVGHWTPGQFIEEFFDTLGKWGLALTIHSQLFEEITMNEVFISAIEEEARRRGVRLNIERIKRSGAENRKVQRILGLQGRFATGRIFFNRTVPRVFADLAQTRELLNYPHEPLNDGSVPVSGELIDQFVYFPRHSRNDIPDALADIDRVDRNGNRICRYVPNSVRRFRSELGSGPRYRPGQAVNVRVDRRGLGGRGWADRAVDTNSWRDRIPK